MTSWMPLQIFSMGLCNRRGSYLHWKDFRPIGLCNVSFKILSTILSIRLSKVLPLIISPTQSGFVSGRHIKDNILLAQEMVEKINMRRHKPNVILKFDMEKDYDRLDQTFFMDMMRDFGFGRWFIDLVYQTLSNNWFFVLINGEHPGQFIRGF